MAILMRAATNIWRRTVGSRDMIQDKVSETSTAAARVAMMAKRPGMRAPLRMGM